MPIRLRLALWYGALCAALIVLVSLLGFSAYSRGQYQTLDQVLVLSANHVSAGWQAAGTSYVLEADITELRVAFRLYDRAGAFKRGSRLQPPVSLLDLPEALEQGIASADDPLTRLLGLPWAETEGVFALAEGRDGQRWRVYLTPLVLDGELLAYLEALTPLGPLDRSVRRLGGALLGFGAVSIAAVFGLGLMLAQGALRPLSALSAMADRVSNSGDLSLRVRAPVHADEIGQLARTFNTMMSSLERASEAQRRFVADASHELRAPLSAIQGNLELMRLYPAMPEADREVALHEAEREAERLTRLVSDLLALAKGDAGIPLRRDSIQLDQVVGEALRDAEHLSRGQGLEGFLEPTTLMGDPDALKQLALILLDNALKYTPPEGWVRVELHPRPGGAELSVQDNGFGIAEEDLPHVFERFYRADKARRRDPGGSGLGLPIARWIVEQHGGTIRLESRPNRGTTVRVWLPTEPGSSPTAHPSTGG